MKLGDKFKVSMAMYGGICFLVTMAITMNLEGLVGESALWVIVGGYFSLPLFLLFDVIEWLFLKWWYK